MEQAAPVLYDRFIVLSIQLHPCRKFFGVKTAILLTCDPGDRIFYDLPRPRPTFSWSPTMAPFRANSIAVFGRSLSRTAPGEWLENLCSFTPGSVPLRPATGDYTFSDAYVIVNSAKSSTRSCGRFFLRNGQSPARAEPARLHYIAGKAESPPQFSPFLRIFRPPKQQNAAASVSGESGAQQRFHWF